MEIPARRKPRAICAAAVKKASQLGARLHARPAAAQKLRGRPSTAHLLDGRDSDTHLAQARVDELVEDGDAQNQRDGVQVRDEIVGQAHGVEYGTLRDEVVAERREEGGDVSGPFQSTEGGAGLT